MQNSSRFTMAQAVIPLFVSLGLVVVVILVARGKPKRVQGGGKAKDHRQPVGTGGKRVTVEQMMVGGRCAVANREERAYEKRIY